MCIFMTALPISVAPKNVPNGTRKCPQVMPARSNKGLGIYNKNGINNFEYILRYIINILHEGGIPYRRDRKPNN